MTKLDPAVFVQAINTSHTSSKGARLFEHLGISERDLKPHPMDEEGGRLLADKRGFQLEFDDVGRHRDLPHHDIGEGPWVLVQFFFRSAIDGGTRYEGELPFGVKFDMDRKALAALFGSPTSSDAVVEYWAKQGYDIVVNFDKKSGAIKSVGLQAQLDND